MSDVIEMKYDISKELLSAVLDEPVGLVEGVFNNNLYFKSDSETSMVRMINIFELMFHFKSWANTNGYMIWSSACTIIVENKKDLHKRTFTGKDEIEGIVQACEFILGEIDGK